jgi:uncharacterized repeat protein (TIGR01451 family)
MNPSAPKHRRLIVLAPLVLAVIMTGVMLVAFNGGFAPVQAILADGIESVSAEVGQLAARLEGRLSAAARQRWQAARTLLRDNRLPATMALLVLAGLVWMFRGRREQVQTVMSGATLLPMLLTPVVELQQLAAFNQPRPVAQQADSTDWLATASAPTLAAAADSFTDLNTAARPVLDLTGFDQPDRQTVLMGHDPAAERSGQPAAPSAVTTIHTFPYIQDFDGFSSCSTSTTHPACTLSQEWVNPTDDDLDWTVDGGGTPSSGTGPDEDHTGSGYYLYTESGSTTNGDVAHLITPQFDLSGVNYAQVSFWYYMDGSGMGTLHVDISTDGGSNWTTDLVSAWTGDTNSWQEKVIDLAAYADQTITLRFRNILTGSGYGDMALDDFTLSNVPPITTFPYNQTFASFSPCGEYDPCPLSENWSNPSGDDNLDWTVNSGTTPTSGTGPNSDHGAGSIYLYTEGNNSDPDDEAHLRTPQFDLAWATAATFSFYYHMYGSGMGDLHVDISTDGGSTWTTDLVTAWTDNDNSWQDKEIDLADYLGQTVTLRLRNVMTGNSRGDMALDDFTVAVTYPDPIDTFPYTQDFESFATCSTTAGDACPLDNVWWNLSDDDIDWTVHAGETVSDDTGPTIDHKPGTAVGNYLYTEASSGGSPSKAAHLVSPEFDLRGADVAYLSVWYHMDGSTMGDLYVDYSTNDGDSWNNITSWTADDNSWQEKIIDLTSYRSQPFRLRLRGITGSSYVSDMAIDDFSVYDSQVRVAKTVSPATGYPGETITYTLAYENLSTSSVSSVSLTDDVPAEVGVWAVTASPTVTDTGATPAYVWQLPTLATGATGTITVTGVVSGTGETFTNTATIADSEGDDSSAAPFNFTNTFSKDFSGTGSYNRFYAADQTSDGGYILAGDTDNFGAGGRDFWVLKLDSSGAVTWQKTYGGSATETATSIQQTSDGGYIVTGYAYSFGAGSSDIWVLKLTSTGAVSWQKTYGGSGAELGSIIRQTSDGGYILAAATNSYGVNYDVWILKLDSSGNVSWQKRYGTTSRQYAHSMELTNDGGYIIAGETYEAGNYDFWVLKLDSAGAIDWQKTYGGTDVDKATSIQQTRDGGYIVAGETKSFAVGLNYDVWVLKLTSTGTVSWQKVYGAVNSNNGAQIVAARDGTYTVASTGPWVFNLDSSSGSINWQRYFTVQEKPGSLLQTSDDGYLIADDDGRVIKLDSTGSLEPSCTVNNTTSVPGVVSATPANSTASATDTAISPATTAIAPGTSTRTPTLTCGGPPSWDFSKTVDDATPNAGDRITYTLTLDNTSPKSIYGVALFDTLPAGQTLAGPMTLSPADAGVVGDANTLPILAHSLKILYNKSISLTLPVTVTSGGSYINTAQAVAVGSTAVDEASQSITVNVYPTGANNTIALDEDADHTFISSQFLYNDADGDAMAGVKIVALPASGSLTCDSTPMVAGSDCTVSAAVQDLVFTPDPDENGSPYASFTFQVKAATGAQYSTATNTLTLNVNPVSDPPVGANRTVTTTENVSYTFQTADFPFNDADGDTLASVQIVLVETAGDLECDGTAVSGGTECLEPAGTVIYSESFEGSAGGWTVGGTNSSWERGVPNDGEINSASDGTQAWVTNLTSKYNSNEQSYVQKFFDFSALTEDPTIELDIWWEVHATDGAKLQTSTDGGTTWTTLGALGALGPPDNWYVYDSIAGLSWTDNEHGWSGLSSYGSQGWVTARHTLSGLAGEAAAGLRVVFGSNSSYESDGFAFDNVRILGVSQLVFTPAPDAAGNPYATFNYKLKDSASTFSAATYQVTINVTGIAEPPTGGNDAVTTPEDTTYTFQVSDFTFSDGDNDAFAGIELAGLETAGDLEYNGGDVVAGLTYADVTQLTFDPALNANGEPYASFDFHVRDSSGMTSTASYEMAITVTAVNDAPVGGSDAVTTPEDTAYTFDASDFPYSDPVEGDAFDGVRLTLLESAGDLECDGTAVIVGTECIVATEIYSESFEGGWVTDIVPELKDINDNVWQEKVIDLSDYVGQTITLRLRGITGSGIYSDMAVDDFTVETDQSTYTQDFESFAICNDSSGTACDLSSDWVNPTIDDHIDWTVHAGVTDSSTTGPSVDHNPGTAGGNFLYTESSTNGAGDGSPDKVAHLVTPEFDLTGAVTATLSFWYHMYGATMGELHVDIYTTDGG